jgi:hypothetical protein
MQKDLTYHISYLTIIYMYGYIYIKQENSDSIAAYISSNKYRYLTSILNKYVEFEVLTVVVMKVAIFC